VFHFLKESLGAQNHNELDLGGRGSEDNATLLLSLFLTGRAGLDHHDSQDEADNRGEDLGDKEDDEEIEGDLRGEEGEVAPHAGFMAEQFPGDEADDEDDDNNDVSHDLGTGEELGGDVARELC